MTEFSAVWAYNPDLRKRHARQAGPLTFREAEALERHAKAFGERLHRDLTGAAINLLPRQLPEPVSYTHLTLPTSDLV